MLVVKIYRPICRRTLRRHMGGIKQGENHVEKHKRGTKKAYQTVPACGTADSAVCTGSVGRDMLGQYTGEIGRYIPGNRHRNREFGG